MIKSKSITQLSKLEKEAVEAAVADAEKSTAAEIYAVLAERSDDYRFVAYGILAFWIFVVSCLLAIFLNWQAGADWGKLTMIAMVPVSYFLWAQLLAFVVGAILFRVFPSFVQLIIPERIAHERAHLNAVKQFLAHGIHHTEHKTGILIFISLQERYGEIIVDRLIEEKIGREYFLKKVEEMLDECKRGNIAKAFEVTIFEIGKRLSDEFPKSKNDRNELADKLIVI